MQSLSTFQAHVSHLWLVGGGNEHDLAKLNGWSSLQMVGATPPRLLVTERDWLIKGSRQVTTFRGESKLTPLSNLAIDIRCFSGAVLGGTHSQSEL